MHIISSHKDYYDSFTTSGSIPVYYRQQKVISVAAGYHGQEIPDAMYEAYNKIPGKYNSGQHGCVFACGKIYPYRMIYKYDTSKWEYCYTIEDCIRTLEKSKLWAREEKNILRYDSIKQELESIDSKPKYSHYSQSFNHTTWGAWQKNESHKLISDEVFQKLNAPIISLFFTGNEYRLTLNPILKLLQFQKVMNPYILFQEIEMFLGTNMAKQIDPEPRGITDKLKAEFHGFNDWSFRKQGKKSKL